MSPQARATIAQWGWKIGGLLLVVGVWYATVNMTLAAKLDTTRFERDSVRRDYRDSSILRDLYTVQRQNDRIIDVLCADRPGGCR